MSRELWARLEPFLRLPGPILAALSGGADSSVLVAALVQAGRGPELLAATFRGLLHPPEEVERAAKLCARLGVAHLILDEDPLADPDLVANPPERCYFCKRRRLAVLGEVGLARGIKSLVDGSNLSDQTGWRPGRRAVAEAGVVTPLAQAGLSKAEVLNLGLYLGLEGWLKPPSACLATRFPYGQRFGRADLERVGRAEADLARRVGLELGAFRVRVEGRTARLEVDPQVWPALLTQREGLTTALRRLGFDHVALDLEGLVSGSHDRAIKEETSG